MKSATSTESLKTRQRRAERNWGVPQRECLPLHDLTDCLLQAYDHVAHRAYEIFVERGERPGGELEDWLIAERELLSELEMDFEESGGFVRALGSVPGFTGGEVSIGIEPHWLLVLARHESGDNSERVEIRPGPMARLGTATRTPDDGSLLPLVDRTATLDGDARPDSPPAYTPLQMFCVLELPAEVDPARSIAVLANGLLAIRMPKK
jgi:HSP20 family molecular chaperone IbpA